MSQKRIWSFPALSVDVMPKATNLCILRTHALLGNQEYRLTRNEAAQYIRAYRTETRKALAAREQRIA